MKIEFDEVNHIYRIDGRRAPGTHDILGLVGVLDGMPDNEFAKRRGTRVHRAIEFDLQGDLHEPDLDDDEMGWVRAARKAVKELGIVVTGTEVLVGNEDLWYATQLDVFGTYRDKPAVINWKTGGYMAYHKLQAAAEASCMSERFEQARLYIYLESNGTYSYKHFKDLDDFLKWEQCCGIANWRIRHGSARLKPDPNEQEGESITIPEANSEIFKPSPPADVVDGKIFG